MHWVLEWQQMPKQRHALSHEKKKKKSKNQRGATADNEIERKSFNNAKIAWNRGVSSFALFRVRVRVLHKPTPHRTPRTHAQVMLTKVRCRAGGFFLLCFFFRFCVLLASLDTWRRWLIVSTSWAAPHTALTRPTFIWTRRWRINGFISRSTRHVG